MSETVQEPRKEEGWALALGYAFRSNPGKAHYLTDGKAVCGSRKDLALVSGQLWESECCAKCWKYATSLPVEGTPDAR